MTLADAPVCHHLDGVHAVAARGRGCEECLATGGHAREVGHPVVESMQPNEGWRWCFVDEVYLDG